jgi:hypothetical protein
MTESCCCQPEAGSTSRELHTQADHRADSAADTCPACGLKGKPVQGQTVKANLLASLREVREVNYLFCKTQSCPVVYFPAGGGQAFTISQVRETVYHKEPENEDAFVCCCFQHKVGEILAASPEARTAILNDILYGIRAGQCACDLRNPQGDCCFGNVRALIEKIDGI